MREKVIEYKSKCGCRGLRAKSHPKIEDKESAMNRIQLFDRVPDRFFSILSSKNKETYAKALFVLHDAFQEELEIRKEDLTARLLDSLESEMMEADFSEDLTPDEAGADLSDLSGKAHFLLRKLKDCGWIETEYARDSFDELITLPDYSIAVIETLYNLTDNRKKEYNSYVYATYAALENSDEHPEYRFQALNTAYNNTMQLVEELKTLYNNIRRYFADVESEMDANQLLATHFDDYKKNIVDAVYYPLKTMDSVPRFKNPICNFLSRWTQDEKTMHEIVQQGIRRKIFENEEQGEAETIRMINSIFNIYDGLDDLLNQIDRRHTDYTNASLEKIRYLINVDRSTRGNLINILQHTDEPDVMEAMQDSLNVHQHRFVSQSSLYHQVKHTARNEGRPLAVEGVLDNPEIQDQFFRNVRKQYTDRRIDGWVADGFKGRDAFVTHDISLENGEDFILFILGTIRGTEKSAPYQVEFEEGYESSGGYRLPKVIFKKKVRRQ